MVSDSSGKDQVEDFQNLFLVILQSPYLKIPDTYSIQKSLDLEIIQM